jgi:hypothetical protein
MKDKKAPRITLFLLLSGAFSFVHAAHPLVTDDTGTQDAGNSQIEINSDHIRQSAQLPNVSNVADVTYTYGATKTLDIFFDAPMTLSSPSGIGDVGLGAKWRFFEREETSLALEPVLLFPTGDANKQLGTGKPGAGVTLIGNWQHGPWTLQGNLAATFGNYEREEDRRTYRNRVWRISTAVRYALDEQWQLVGDTGVLRDALISQRTNPMYALAGFIYSPVPYVDLDAGLRFGLNCSSCASQVHRQFGAGLTWRF